MTKNQHCIFSLNIHILDFVKQQHFYFHNIYQTSSHLTSSRNLSNSRAGNWESLGQGQVKLWANLNQQTSLPPYDKGHMELGDEKTDVFSVLPVTHFIWTPSLPSTITRLGSMFFVISSKAFSGIMSVNKHKIIKSIITFNCIRWRFVNTRIIWNHVFV